MKHIKYMKCSNNKAKAYELLHHNELDHKGRIKAPLTEDGGEGSSKERPPMTEPLGDESEELWNSWLIAGVIRVRGFSAAKV